MNTTNHMTYAAETLPKQVATVVFPSTQHATA